MQIARFRKAYFLPAILWLSLGTLMFHRFLLPIIVNMKVEAASELYSSLANDPGHKGHEGTAEQ